MAFVGHGYDAPPGTNVIDRNYGMQVLSARTVRRFGSLPATDTAPTAGPPARDGIDVLAGLLREAVERLWSVVR